MGLTLGDIEGRSEPGLLKLHLQEVSDGLVLTVVVDGPVDAELAVLGDQLQDSAKALGHVELGVLSTLLPGVHCQEFQHVLGGQRAFPLGLLGALRNEEKDEVLVHIDNEEAWEGPSRSRKPPSNFY